MIADENIQILSPAGGWGKVIDRYHEKYISYLKKYEHAFVILLIDFDNNLERRKNIESDIPVELRDRTFLLGSLDDPEQLKKELILTFEEIGKVAACACVNESLDFWQHPVLCDNLNSIKQLHSSTRIFGLKNQTQ